MHAHHVVVEDPEGTFNDGSLVDPGRAAVLAARGSTLLPVEPEAFALSAASGYFRRAWGAGWPLDARHPVMAAQMLIHGDPTRPWLHWAARLAASTEAAEEMERGFEVRGSLRIAGDSSQRTPHSVRLTPKDDPINPGRLGRPDRLGGWVVRGRALMHVGSEGPCGIALYGHAPGLRVVWAAITATSTEF